MLPPSAVSILLVQGTFIILGAHPGLTFRLPFLFRNRPPVKHEALRHHNDMPLVFAFCNVDQIRNLLSKSSTSLQSELAEVVANDVQQPLNKKSASKGRDVPEGNREMAALPQDEKKLIPVSGNIIQLVDAAPAKLPLPVTTAASASKHSAPEQGGAPGDSPEASAAPPPRTTLAPSGRRRRSLSDLAGSALELAKSGPGVQGDMVGAALEMAGSVAADKVRALAVSGGQALDGVAGPVGKITSRTLSAAGSVAGQALRAAGAGGGAVVRKLGAAADSVAEFLGVG